MAPLGGEPTHGLNGRESVQIGLASEPRVERLEPPGRLQEEWRSIADAALRLRDPEDRVYTVISGVFYIGLGDRFDADKLEAYPPGTVVVLPGGTPHFHWARSGEYVSQVTAIGPLGLDYVDPHDDPRNG